MLPRVAKQRQPRKEKETVLIEINAVPTPLTETKVSDYLIQGKTGQILPKIVEEVSRISKRETFK
jgi:hypothetical protein